MANDDEVDSIKKLAQLARELDPDVVLTRNFMGEYTVLSKIPGLKIFVADELKQQGELHIAAPEAPEGDLYLPAIVHERR